MNLSRKLRALLRRLRRKPVTRVDPAHEAALDSLRRYAAFYLAADQLPRAKHYWMCCRTDYKLISLSRLQRQGRFQDLCAEAGI